MTMQTSELRGLYKEACKSMRQEPDEAEFKMWKHVLGGHDARDVRGALEEHWAGERGMFLPKPAELRPEAERLAQNRRAEETPEFCEDSILGWRRVLVDEKLANVQCVCPMCVRARTA
jgi:hypothetical protein